VTKRPFALAAVFSLLGLFACVVAPKEPESQSNDSPLNCTDTQRFFNGACRAICDTNTACGGTDRCMTVEKGTALCLDYQHCAHLGSDTQCFGTGRYYASVFRSGWEERPYDSQPQDANPYDVTPYVDPYFEGEPYTQAYDQLGCMGNARWETTAAVGEPSCGQEQEVVRCRHYEHGCFLVPGHTTDFVAP
jgi:hypothetical protein